MWWLQLELVDSQRICIEDNGGLPNICMHCYDSPACIILVGREMSVINFAYLILQQFEKVEKVLGWMDGVKSVSQDLVISQFTIN